MEIKDKYLYRTNFHLKDDSVVEFVAC